MPFQTLIVKEANNSVTLTINRLQNQNSIDSILLEEINQVLDDIEKKPDCRVVILEGQAGIFCTGMDFNEISELSLVGNEEEINLWAFRYQNTLKRFASISKVMVAKIDGKVLAGGMGLAAACDLVIASKQATFCLPETLWGLLPAMIAPYLIRRIGFQKTYAMALTSYTIPANEALAMHLIDELSENLEESLQRLQKRLIRLEESTVTNLKIYFKKMWILSEEMEDLALKEIKHLMLDPTIQTNIRNFVMHHQLPWENKTH